MQVKLFWCDKWNDGVLYPEGLCKNAPSNFKGLIFSFLNDDGKRPLNPMPIF